MPYTKVMIEGKIYMGPLRVLGGVNRSMRLIEPEGTKASKAEWDEILNMVKDSVYSSHFVGYYDVDSLLEQEIDTLLDRFGAK